MPPNIPASRMGKFLQVILALLWSKQQGVSSREIMLHLSRVSPLMGEELSPSDSAPGFSCGEVAVRSSLLALEKAGWLLRSDHRWFLTDAGRLACKDFTDPQDFYTESTRYYHEWQAKYPAISLVVEDAEEKAWEQIRGYLQALTPYEFRRLISDLFQAMGFFVAWMAPPGKERGQIELITYPDPLGIKGPRAVVQIKHKGHPVSFEEVQASLAILGEGDIGILVSPDGFTDEALEMAALQREHTVSLIDLEKFFGLWVKHYQALTQGARQRLPVKAIYFLSFQD